MHWQIATFPRYTHHVFLSHAAEDRSRLVVPLWERLVARGVIPWLDRDDYTYGRSSRAALRDGILKCRHVVLLITDAMLRYNRGWCLLELAYAELLQANVIWPGGDLQHVILPLFIVRRNDRRLPRTVWQDRRTERQFFPGRLPLRNPVAKMATNMLTTAGILPAIATFESRAAWAADQILQFLRHEQGFTQQKTVEVSQDPILRAWVQSHPGLLERITSFEPGPIP
jgi:hypothetical protein